MAWAGLKFLTHTATLELTDVNVASVTQTLYDSSDLTSAVEYEYTLDSGVDPTLYLNIDSPREVQIVATQSDDSALVRNVQASPHMVVEVDLAPSADQIAADTDRIDDAVQTLDDELTSEIGLKVSLVGEDDMTITTSSAGVILTSPDGTQFRLGVSDLGEVTTEEVTP